jgi:hypothetical protein
MENRTTQLYDCRCDETKEKITMTPAAGRIAAVVGADSVTTQALLAAMVNDWRALGAKVVGVLTTVSDRHRDAWQAFAPDATLLPADEAVIQDWWRAVRTR